MAGHRPDIGRLIMVPAAAGLLVLDAASLRHAGSPGLLGQAGTAVTVVFYGLTVWCYLRRGAAIATSTSAVAHAAAVLATLAPFGMPLLRQNPPPGPAWQLAGGLLLLAGTGWAGWSLRFLGRNLSVLAQARDLVDTGPYRLIRHPLYTGEIVSSLGLALLAGGAAPLAVWLAICALQACRATQEERVLAAALPGYRGYQGRTAALLPGVF